MIPTHLPYHPLAALVLFGVLAVSAAHAESAKGHQGAKRPGQAVTTQPSNSPFSNPIMQPLPPAVSVNPAQNSNRSNVPINGPVR